MQRSRAPGTVSDERALLLTDVVDSTALSESLGDTAMAELWAAHDRVARDLAGAHGAGARSTRPTACCCCSTSAADAVGYALDYHRALAALPTRRCARASACTSGR